MKANRKFKQKRDAVSSVIGVILMVAITVAIAATVYVFVSVLVIPSNEELLITFSPDWDEKTLTVIKISIKDVNWSDIQKGNSICILPSGTVDAGDIITGCNGTVALSYQNITLLGSWEFT